MMPFQCFNSNAICIYDSHISSSCDNHPNFIDGFVEEMLILVGFHWFQELGFPLGGVPSHATNPFVRNYGRNQ
ncbi:hypothetical protein Nepgr_032363 [Nepenthes gracilis]|uniref:Uncharacterized protein n=1 Tax=Nepenthes gracilis TaxID=150966 RepID=A0AAD3TJ51_NEPGR|nr:hypothetical protein Nepgr_032363 [Nepenthes gracilis]